MTLASLKALTGNDTIRSKACEFLFVFHCIYGHIVSFSATKRDIGRNSRFFSHQLLHNNHSCLVERRLALFHAVFSQPSQFRVLPGGVKDSVKRTMLT